MNVNSQRGVGLIEILVSLLILGLAVLGFSMVNLQSVKATTESVDRTQVLIIMRSFTEKIKANSSAMSTYVDEFTNMNAATPTASTPPDCQANSCNPSNIAKSDVAKIKSEIDNLGIKMNLVACPSTGTSATASTATANNVMYSYCLISSWGHTNPTIGSDDDPSDGSMDCISGRVMANASTPTVSQTGGKYHRKSTCMFMEVN